MVEANRTVCIPLEVPTDRESDLHRTYRHYQYCQQQTIEHCWPDTPKHPDDLYTDKGEAEDALYHHLRADTDTQLHANLVQKAIKDAVSAVGSCKSNWEDGDRVNKPDFYDREKSDYAMTYDRRAASYKPYEATFATINGTVTCRFILPDELTGTPYGEYIGDSRWSFTTSKLVYDGE